MEMLQGDVHMRALFNPRVKLSPADVRKSVEAAVDLFLNGARPRAVQAPAPPTGPGNGG